MATERPPASERPCIWCGRVGCQRYIGIAKITAAGARAVTRGEPVDEALVDEGMRLCASADAEGICPGAEPKVGRRCRTQGSYLLSCDGRIRIVNRTARCEKCGWRGHCGKCGKGMQFADGICFECNGGRDPGE